MIYFRQYVERFLAEEDKQKQKLGESLRSILHAFSIQDGGDPVSSFPDVVEFYNWLGRNKKTWSLGQNMLRNVVGSFFQEYLINVVISASSQFPQLDAFAEVRVPFGNYPLWHEGNVTWETPGEMSDIAVGYLVKKDDLSIIGNDSPPPRVPFYKIGKDQSVLPLVTVNTKIRVSQPEFFDWHGREQLMTKGNPHCWSVQVALRKEMDMNIVDAAQAKDKFFLLGHGGEMAVNPNRPELDRFLERLTYHLSDRMTPTRA